MAIGIGLWYLSQEEKIRENPKLHSRERLMAMVKEQFIENALFYC